MKLHLELTPGELDYIANLLAQQPWGQVNQLLANLKGQVDYQQKVAASETTGYIQSVQPNGHDAQPVIQN